ncbi:MAG: PD-(D/E)XK nuclease family protein [Janthinobacterium lividum]
MSELIACLYAVAATVSRVEHENRLVNRYTARDFTPFRFLSGWGEVPSTHMLAFFLNPDEDHGQGVLFQELFILRLRTIPVVGARLPAGPWRVEAERRHAGYGQLDLLLTAADGSFGICLENKPRDQTIDQYQQLTSYRKLLRHRHYDNYLLLYLSRKTREPHPDSLSHADRDTLTCTGHYANITYDSFVLSLLDDWYQAVYPESLRIFLRQFRHHVEQWLQFESTKPAQLMQEQEIATTLAASATNVRVAFQIQASISTLREQLLIRLTKGLMDKVAGITGAPHWRYGGFFKAETSRPFLIRRPSPTGKPEDLPWDRYSITLEFMDGKLFYGVRFDHIDWYEDDNQTAIWSDDIVARLSPVSLSEVATHNEWWPWYAWAGPTNDFELYPAIADSSSSLWQKLKPEIVRLANVLDEWSALSTAVKQSEQAT